MCLGTSHLLSGAVRLVRGIGYNMKLDNHMIFYFARLRISNHSSEIETGRYKQNKTKKKKKKKKKDFVKFAMMVLMNMKCTF